MSSGKLTRLETSILSEDAALLRRVAERRGCTVAEIIRAALYVQVEPLRRAAAERDAVAAREILERQALKAWNAQVKE